MEARLYFCIPALLVMLVMVYLSVHKGGKPVTKHEIVRREQTGIVPSETQKVAMRKAEADERAHRRNHADKVRLTRELASMTQSPINYSDPIPRLPAGGDVIDAELEDVPPQLPSGRTKSWTLREIREDWERNNGR